MKPQEQSTALTGGVASDIAIVQGADGPQVVKQALGKLKVAADWFSNPARSCVEVAALRVAHTILGPGAVPKVLWADAETHSFGMSYIGHLRNWKQDLLAGHVDLATACRAGELLGTLHQRTSTRTDIAADFADTTYFHELRVQPFFDRVAERNAALAAQIHAAAQGMGQRRSALVHGDYSPKNLLADGAEVVVLDWEVAHWGDPRFDVAFCVSHLLLKSLRRQAEPAPLLAAISAFAEGYKAEHAGVWDAPLPALVACLLLARIEGASPVDYIADLEAADVKALATALLNGERPDAARVITEQLKKA